MTNEELIQKLRGLQRYYASTHYDCAVMEKGDHNDEWINRDDIEELINELEKPKLLCETVNATH